MKTITPQMQNVIDIAENMGLRFNVDTNFKDMIDREIVVFDGAGSQRVLIDTKLDMNDIYATLGDAMIEYGKRSRSMEINLLLKPY